MIRVRIEGSEEEMLEFMGKMPDIPGFEKTHMREPRKGNNPKYDSSKMYLHIDKCVAVFLKYDILSTEKLRIEE